MHEAQKRSNTSHKVHWHEIKLHIERGTPFDGIKLTFLMEFHCTILSTNALLTLVLFGCFMLDPETNNI